MDILKRLRLGTVLQHRVGIDPSTAPPSELAHELGVLLRPGPSGTAFSLRGRVLRYDAESNHPNDVEALVARGLALRIKRLFLDAEIQRVDVMSWAEVLYATLSGCGLTSYEAQQNPRPSAT